MTTVWIVWLTLVLTSFGILEAYGMKKHGVKGTLSYQFWSWMFFDEEKTLQNERPTKRRDFVWWIITALLLWLTLHMATGGMV